ncbi:hypothetical protein H8D30_03120 [bacterium]|nr:hypothetical protein [bacterium]
MRSVGLASFLILGIVFTSCQGVNLDHTLVYLVNRSPDEVLVVDVDLEQVQRRFMAGEGLSDIHLYPEQGLGYVTNQHGGTIVIVDLAKGSVKRELQTPGFPLNLAIGPGGKEVFSTIAHPDTMEALGVSVFDVETGERTGYIELGNTVHMLRSSPDRHLIYALRANSAKVYIIDAQTKEVLRVRQLSHSPSDLAVSPDGKWFAVTLTQADTVQIYDAMGETLAHSVPVTDAPQNVTFSEDSSLVMAADMRTRFVHVIDTLTGETRGKIRFDMAPTHLSFAEGLILVSVDAPFLFGADPLTLEVTKRIPLNSLPVDFEALPRGAIIPDSGRSVGPGVLVAFGVIAFLFFRNRGKKKEKETSG